MPITEGGGRNRTTVTTKPRRAARRIGGVVQNLQPKPGGPSTRTTRTTTRTTQPRSQPRRTTGGGGGGRTSGGGGGGGSFRSGGGGSVPRPAPPPKPMSIKDWLAGDVSYQQAQRGGKRTLNDLLSDLTRQRGEATTSFGQTKQDVERNRGLQLERLADEFASRGLIHSGIYGEEQGRFQEQFANQLQQLEQQQASLLADLLSQETGFRREQDLAMESAKQEALRRRAEKFNIPL